MEDDGDNSSKSHYDEVTNYYSNIPATVDGMLNGYSDISDLDIKTSDEFLQALFNRKSGPGRRRALDVGAGIGRISKHLLSKYFDKIDLLEQSSIFVEEAKVNLEFTKKLDKCYNVGIQDFTPDDFNTKYDVIWIQWVLLFVLDEDIIKFINLCKQLLNENGVIVIKDNIASGIRNEYDDEDSSVVRSLSQFLLLFTKAELKCLKYEKVNGMPKPLFRVYMFALRPN